MNSNLNIKDIDAKDTDTKDVDKWGQRKELASSWFKELRDKICSEFETLETELSNGEFASDPAGKFEKKLWDRGEQNQENDSGSVLNGGGEISLMRGRVFEKVGVNISEVYGTFSKDFRKEIPGGEESDGAFWAAGISLVAHMRSPKVPAVHMNTRMIVSSKGWFGGGADLNPVVEIKDDTNLFHSAFKKCCNKHDPNYYDKFKKWCDEYFYIKHRNKARGVGGIFYDYLENNWDDDFAFTKDVGLTFLDVYPKIVREHINEPWTDEERENQLIKRGHYAEYNLLYDRGTRFGLMTGGNTEAILMSLPPEAKWP